MGVGDVRPCPIACVANVMKCASATVKSTACNPRDRDWIGSCQHYAGDITGEWKDMPQAARIEHLENIAIRAIAGLIAECCE